MDENETIGPPTQSIGLIKKKLILHKTNNISLDPSEPR